MTNEEIIEALKEMPLLQASELVKKVSAKTKLGTKTQIKLICSLIETHMGQWNEDRDGNTVAPKPFE